MLHRQVRAVRDFINDDIFRSILKEEITKDFTFIVHWEITHWQDLLTTERVMSAIVSNVCHCVRSFTKGYLVHLNT